MAIYKPSNCRPFLNAVDLTKDLVLQCEINTSNQNITGYKIKLLDNNNVVIFEGQDYDLLPNGGSFNGSILQVTFIKTYNSDYPNQIPNWATEKNNIIYCDIAKSAQGIYKYYRRSGNGSKEVINLSNGFVDMPYKWIITVAQGQQINSGVITVADDYYDILTTTGQILGSTEKKVQSFLSDEIYKDYYIQLFNEANEQVGDRVRITSYDRSFGYIYPQEGFLTSKDIDDAYSFSIYKDTNDPQYVSAGRTVDFGIVQPIEKARWAEAFGVEGEFTVGEFETTSNKYYCEMKVGELTRKQYKDFNSNPLSLSTLFGNVSNNVDGNITYNGTRFLFMQQSGETIANNYYHSTASPLNGVWVFSGATGFEAKKDQAEGVKDTDDAAIGTCVLRWQRPAEANTWANYLNRSWFVSQAFAGSDVPNIPNIQGGVNVSSNAGTEEGSIIGASGVINSTNLIFFPETPVTIYPDLKDMNGLDLSQQVGVTPTRGVIFKNQSEQFNNQEQRISNGKIYLKPFSGLREGMRIRWGNIDSNGVISTRYFDIKSLDSNYWWCEPSTPIESEATILIPGTSYKVYSYFKQSDENPFYAYTKPTLVIKTTQELTPNNKYPFISLLNSRILEAYGEYIQPQNIAWKSFKWKLYDASINSTIETPTTYNGQIYYKFEGIQDDHRYELTLEIEDEAGYVVSTILQFQVKLPDWGDQKETFPLKVSFDCDTQSMDINFTRNGYIIPNYSMYPGYETTIPSYGKDAMQIHNGETVSYDTVEAVIVGGKDGETVSALLTGPETNDFTLNAGVTKVDPRFNGDLVEISIVYNETPGNHRMRLGVLLPPSIILQDGYYVPNPARNEMPINYWSEVYNPNEELWQYEQNSLVTSYVIFNPQLVQFDSDTDKDFMPPAGQEVFYWRKPKPIVYSLQAPASLNSLNTTGFDYLPISYYDPTDPLQHKQGQLSNTGLQVQDGDSNYVYFYLGPNEYNCSSTVLPFPLNHHSENFTVVNTANANYDDYKVRIQESQSTPNEFFKVREYGQGVEDLTIWQDSKSFLATQINDVTCNVKAKERMSDGTLSQQFVMNKWQDNQIKTGGFNRWNDECSSPAPVWKGVDVNSKVGKGLSPDYTENNIDGRQDIAALTEKQVLAFNIAVKNFDIEQVSIGNLLEISGKCYIKGV